MRESRKPCPWLLVQVRLVVWLVQAYGPIVQACPYGMVLAPAALRTVSPAQIALAWPFGETSNECPYSPSHLGGLRVNLVANLVSQRSVVGFFV